MNTVDRFTVDLSALEEVRRRLSTMLGQLDGTAVDAKYKTTIPAGCLGAREDRFQEAAGLRLAHDTAKESIGAIVTHLTSLIDSYRTKTGIVHGSYQDSDAAAKHLMQ
ncbi:hypothetical protein ACIGXM_35180 [Kitasatospora sp. NPDC052896]|uniref:hypothetical protein n=1 Tax=Kitasatospora sp. NPDC052896 TaxID=3364061 RepID=UPI0037CC9E05